MGTPTRPAKSLKELVSSYQDRKEIKSHSTSFNSKNVVSKKKSVVAKKERKFVVRTWCLLVCTHTHTHIDRLYRFVFEDFP